MSERIRGYLPWFCLSLTLNLANLAFLPIRAFTLQPPNLEGGIRGQLGEVAEYKPPKGLGTPPTAGGGTRGGKCEQDREISGPSLTAVMPRLTSASDFGLTVEANPQFFVYVPETAARMAEFALKDESDNDVYRKNMAISGEAGIVSASLPQEVALEVGKNYHWYFSIICNPENRREDIFADGWTRRIELSSALANELKEAAPRDRANLYAEAGIWHEALTTLAQLRREAPNNSEQAADWKKFLESAGLSHLADLPLLFTARERVP